MRSSKKKKCSKAYLRNDPLNQFSLGHMVNNTCLFNFCEVKGVYFNYNQTGRNNTS